jgi:hypothetical protein
MVGTIPGPGGQPIPIFRDVETGRGQIGFEGEGPGAELTRQGLEGALDVGIAAGTTLLPGGKAVESAAALAGTKIAIGGARTAAALERLVGTRVGAALFSSRGGLLNTGVFRIGVSTKVGQPQFRIAIGGGRDPFLKIDLGSSLSKLF